MSTESTGTGGVESSAYKPHGRRNSGDRFTPYEAEDKPSREPPAASGSEGGEVGDSEFDDPIEVVASSPMQQTLTEPEE